MTDKAILLMNLGSPDSPQVEDVKKYLDEFLMDPYVIDLPYLFRLIVVKGLITPFRAKRSAEAYQKIWQKEGSPLIINTKNLTKKCQNKTRIPIEY